MKTINVNVDINAHIIDIKCEIDVGVNPSKALVSFYNLGFGTITAVKFNAKGYNSFGDIVKIGGKDEFFLIIQDMTIEKNSMAKDLKVNLPHSDIRKLELEECQICYADGLVTTYAGENYQHFLVDVFDSSDDREVLSSVRDVVSNSIGNLPTENEVGWICSCSRFNFNDTVVCSKCGITKEQAFKLNDPEFLSMTIETHKKNEEKKRTLAVEEAEKKRKVEIKRKFKRAIVVVICLLFVFIIGRLIILSNRSTFSSETEMREALQGTYTHYDSLGNASRQIVISEDKAIYKWSSSDSLDMTTDITKWDYKNGKIHTFENLVITSSGGLKDGKDLYRKTDYGYKSELSSSYESGYSVLDITIDSVTNNSSYTVCTGSVKNNGTKTYKYIEVKGSFKDSGGDVVDTDWTYAAGSEGLSPGESSTFRLSVPKNSRIDSCSVSILDFS